MSARAKRPSPPNDARRRPLALALAAVVLAGCGPRAERRAAPGPPVYGGQFVFPCRVEPSTLNFVSGYDFASAQVTRLIGDGLVDHDARLETVPRLASSWDWSADGRVLTFHLRPGVRFHDGAPLTSADVLYTYQKAADPRSRAVGRLDAFLPVERVEAVDPLTVRVTYHAPYAPALEAWEMPILPRHLYEHQDFLTSPLNRAPVGSGPFRFGEWATGRRIVLLANTDYWGGRPYLDRLVFDFIPSQETTLQALLAGEVDFATLTPVQWEAHRSDPGFPLRFRTFQVAPLFYYYIAWRGDGSNPFFADAGVRRAMTLALDREGYVRTVLRGLGRVVDSPIRPGSPGDEPTLSPAAHDPQRAAALLDAAGWRVDPRTGVRERGGTPFRFRLLIYGSGEDHVQFAQVAQESLRRVGVDMSIDRLDWPTLWTRLQKGAFAAALSGVAPGRDPDSLYGMLHSSQIAGGQNYAAIRDPELDRLLDEGRRTLDRAARDVIYRRVDRRLRDLQPYTYLFAPMVQAAVARSIGNVEASPLGILDLSPGAARFYVSPDRVR